MMRLNTEIVRNESDWTLKLVGDVSAKTAKTMWNGESSASLLDELKQAVVQLLIIDLSAVESMDSHALRHLLNARKEFSQDNIQIVLRNPNSHLRRLFRIMQFDRLFNIEPESLNKL